MEANKKAVAEFYEFAVNKKDFDAAVTFLGPRYVQHNPNAADGPEGLKAYIAFLRDKSPTHTATSSAFSPTATTSSSTACRLRARAVLPS
jgi:predicted SnoaL-like aldol condensation-catalyzing enzyme